MLTKKQKELLELLIGYNDRGEICPSFDEMRDEIGVVSKANIHRLISALEERGYIRRAPNTARAIKILRRPSDDPTPAFLGGKAMPDNRTVFVPVGIEMNKRDWQTVEGAAKICGMSTPAFIRKILTEQSEKITRELAGE